MNRKIFTLLACALMLFSTAFTINAKVVGGNLTVGDTVRTLPTGKGMGMYHIRIDSIRVNDGGGWRWQPIDSALFNTPIGDRFDRGDTLIVGVTDAGRVIPVSASDLRTRKWESIEYMDLQATMWCVNVEEEEEYGQMPTFHFTNKVFGYDLDPEPNQSYVVSGPGKGWMYSRSYDNGQLNAGMPLRRFASSTEYTVLTYSSIDTCIVAKNVSIEAFTKREVEGMLSFTIVEVAPVVLSAKDFNTKLGEYSEEGQVELNFNPAPNSETNPNYFGYKLKAKDGFNRGYLNLYINGSDTVIYNRDATYTNDLGVKHLKILADGKQGRDTSLYNDEYRLVYFPSKDSLVINAYKVGHKDHNSIANGRYRDEVVTGQTITGEYVRDGLGAAPLYYGLYTREIHDFLIVRLQDLYGNRGTSLMTIGKHPANTRISFGVNNCNEIEIDVWTPDEGLYTIWDNKGRVLGVRPYNGALVAQWIELRNGECPDRIPSYQWIIEKVKGESGRVDIINREFGAIKETNPGTKFVRMDNVLIKNRSTQIFLNQSQFNYYAIHTDRADDWKTVRYGFVTGQYLEENVKGGCIIKESESGFRPVNNAYANDKHLGYKFFYVNTKPGEVSFGKSEDIGTAKGMDYNAFAFSYLHEYTESSGKEGYIDLKANEGDSVLFVNTQGKEGFQFRLGRELNNSSQNYVPEKFGYRKAPSYELLTYPYSREGGREQSVAALERYYYEFKVADFYNYRDSLAEQYVVLKGAAANGSDIANKYNYGVANVYAYTDPFKFANVYLRETYFLPKDKKLNEERSEQDDSRRIYYALIDRIEEQQFNRLAEMGYEILDTLQGADGSSKYGLLMLGVDDYSGIIRGITKTTASTVMSTFALENMNYPLYRRLASKEDDGAVNNGDGAPCPFDAPKTLRFYKQTNNRLFLYEDAISSVSDNLGINFLGQANADQFPEDVAAADGFYKYNYNLFVDTAYINRGTGWIKPQYLIAVGAEVTEAKKIRYFDDCNEERERTLLPYIRGRYLINATDSARVVGSNGANTSPVRDKRYIIYSSWDRLAFVDAIHVDDRLYIVSQLAGIPQDVKEGGYMIQDEDDGKWYVDGERLRELTASMAREPLNSKKYGAYYDFEDWQNYHNDVCFSLRFVNSYAQNPSELTGEGGTDNDSKAFMIESETTNRNPYGNRKIAPVQGGWIKMENGVPVISRGSYEDAIGQAEIFNVAIGTGEATANDPVSSDASVKVISGTDEISVLNANGKQVMVTNLLGQTIVNLVPNSDNVTVKAPKGIVIVTVEGEKAVKSIVK